MTPEELEAKLRAWGRIYGEAPTRDDDDRSGPAVHPLAVAMQHAPRRRSEVIRQRTNMDRGGQDRRRHMGKVAGLAGMLPAHFVDPIPSTASRGGAKSPPTIPAELQRVNRAILNLQAVDPVRGLCLRVHYCCWGTLEERAEEASRRHGEVIKVRSYRDAVKDAKFWLMGALAEQAA